jgi:hypothetical protein
MHFAALIDARPAATETARVSSPSTQSHLRINVA